jgi:TonB family protein
MHEAVDDVIQRRRIDPAGLGRIMSASIAIHLGTVLLLFVVPRDWFVRDEVTPLLMTISLGGSPGERSGGMVSAGARPVEQVAPPPKRPEHIPPATPPKPDVIAVPTKAPPKTPPKTADSAKPSTAKPRLPTTGAKVTKGTAVADTGATGQTGLTFGGGAVGDTQVKLDTAFCCPEYIAELQRRILANWNKNQPVTGTTTVVFEILKDGSFTKPVLETSSGNVLLDRAAIDAFGRLRLQPLPAEYKEDRLKIHLSFPYVR